MFFNDEHIDIFCYCKKKMISHQTDVCTFRLNWQYVGMKLWTISIFTHSSQNSKFAFCLIRVLEFKATAHAILKMHVSHTCMQTTHFFAISNHVALLARISFFWCSHTHARAFKWQDFGWCIDFAVLLFMSLLLHFLLFLLLLLLMCASICKGHNRHDEKEWSNN